MNPLMDGTITPSKYQQAIYDQFERSSDSLLIEAVAGSGKTSTLVGLSEIIAKVFPAQKAAFLAFNRGIANELQRRISAPNVASMTLHAAGWASWKRSLGMDSNLCEVDGGKVHKILRELLTWQESQRFGESTRKLVSAAKGLGIVPRGTFAGVVGYAGLVEDTDETWDGLIEHYALDEEDCDIGIVRKVLARSIEQAGDICDFDDMLYMPVIAGVPFDRFDIVLVDEAQDLSGIQHEMIERMAGGARAKCDCPPYWAGEDAPLADFCPMHGLEEYRKQAGARVIAVGDRHQAIYAFRGAHSDSMNRLAERFGMVRLPLSVSYRCPRAVVELARTWVPEIEGAESAVDGYVGVEGTDWAGQSQIAMGCCNCHCEFHGTSGCKCIKGCGHESWGISKWQSASDLHAGDAILCRNTRPLVSAAFALIRRRIRVVVLGRDIGKGLVQLVNKAKLSESSSCASFEDWLADYHDRERARLAKRQEWGKQGLLQDRVDALKVFIDQVAIGGTVGQLIREIESLFGDQEGVGMVTLATVHKAKGLEWERVFVLDANELMPSPYARQSWERDQERNLMYVAATRARRELRYIRSEEIG